MLNFKLLSTSNEEKQYNLLVINKNPILSISPCKHIYNSRIIFSDVTDEALALLESEYSDIKKRLTQNKLFRKAVILAQNLEWSVHMRCIACDEPLFPAKLRGYLGAEVCAYNREQGFFKPEKTCSVTCFVCPKCGQITLRADDPKKLQLP